MSTPKNRGQRKPKPHGRYWIYTTNELAELFSVSRATIQLWIRENKLDPTSLWDVLHKYNNRHLLDYRRKK